MRDPVTRDPVKDRILWGWLVSAAQELALRAHGTSPASWGFVLSRALSHVELSVSAREGAVPGVGIPPLRVSFGI